jgi:hypothetical protein
VSFGIHPAKEASAGYQRGACCPSRARIIRIAETLAPRALRVRAELNMPTSAVTKPGLSLKTAARRRLGPRSPARPAALL